ncbi:mannose-6-phosphate receptor binding domain-containing protein [Endogone sp. FLAS-F59071]|nr:mannose-6-phosphate receptor binding domain-containing protein [Endogone sp. FLAS-F59071]|eukprot:RUS21007.1 mannose-6-phosphate receptor binding domain-containing protein [Endogone sp. FLAS-F59071]
MTFYLKTLFFLYIVVLATITFVFAEEELPKCTTKNFNGNYFDLSPLTKTSGEWILLVAEGKITKGNICIPFFYVPRDDWVIDGADSGMQFRINICAELIYKQTGLKNPDGVASFGQDKGFANFDLGVHTYIAAIINRKSSTAPFFRGKKLLLQYQNGDECPRDPSKHRSTLISFICDKSVINLASDLFFFFFFFFFRHSRFDPERGNRTYLISSLSFRFELACTSGKQGNPVFISEADQCFYWFEWATPAACATTRSVSGLTGWGTFIMIACVFTSAYCLGGMCYMRIVHKASGFNQIPNWEFWYNIYDWTKVLFFFPFFSNFHSIRDPPT